MLHTQQSSFIFACPERTPDIKEYTANMMFHYHVCLNHFSLVLNLTIPDVQNNQNHDCNR
jgi:hypothetical protein